MKIINLIVIMCISIVLCGSSYVSALDKDAILIYDGKTKEFIFQNIQQDDFLSDFKNMIPGDEKSSVIYLETNNLSQETTFYLKAEADKDIESYFKDMTMDVFLDDVLVSDDQFVFDNILLKKTSLNGISQLKVKLTIPVTLGNEEVTQNFQLKWVFTAQEAGEDVIVDNIPDTLDYSNLQLYLAVMVVALMYILFEKSRIYK